MNLARRMLLVPCSLLVSLAGCSTSVEPGIAPLSSEPAPLVDAPDACTQGDLGDGACVDPGTFKLAASQACAEGLYLTDLQLDAAACADGLFASASYVCCPPAPPADPPPAKDPGSPSTCVEHTRTSAACEPVATLEAEAGSACAAEGLTLADRKFGGACADGEATEAWFTCCASTPGPDPSSCVESVLSNGACQDMGALKTQAVGGCAEGLALYGLTFEGDCEGGQALTAHLLCCAP